MKSNIKIILITVAVIIILTVCYLAYRAYLNDKKFGEVNNEIATINSSQKMGLFGTVESAGKDKIVIKQLEDGKIVEISIDDKTGIKKLNTQDNSISESNIDDIKTGLNVNISARINSDGTYSADNIEITIK